MKRSVLVYVVLYYGDVLAVCRSRALARKLCKQHVLEADYYVDKFEIKELPLV